MNAVCRNVIKLRNCGTVRKYNTKVKNYHKHYNNYHYQKYAAISLSTFVTVAYFGFSSANIGNDTGVHGHDFINNDTIPIVNLSELNLHNKKDDCWVSIHGHVYDVTDFIDSHPGGADKLLKFAGKDATRGFRMQHNEGYLERFLGEEKYRGELLVPEKDKRKSAKEKKQEKKKKIEEEKERKRNEKSIEKLMKKELKEEIKEDNTVKRENRVKETKINKTETASSDVISKSELDNLIKSSGKLSKESNVVVIKKSGLSSYYSNIVDKYVGKSHEKRSGTKTKSKLANKEENAELVTIENKPKLNQIFSLNDFEYVAQKVLPNLLYSYIQSGTDNETSRIEERSALCRIFFRPKCLVDVTQLDMNNTVVGVKTELPFLIGSFGGSGLIQDEGEKLVVRSVVNQNGLQIIPKDSDVSLDDIMKESKGKDMFYQYSIDNKKELVNSVNILNDIIAKYPNIKGVFIDIDNSNSANLEHYKKIEASKHQYDTNPAPQLKLKSDSNEFKLCWSDLSKIKEGVSVPVILKGIQKSEDILKSQELGFDGVLISNHEGKALDQNKSSIEILHDVHGKIKNKQNFSVFIEGSFRRGSDIVKAMCLGGKPVLSKPILFSEIYGEEGVNKSIEILKKEISTTMKLIGARSISELNEEFIDCESLNIKTGVVRNLDFQYDNNYTNMPPPPFNNQDKLIMI